MSALPGHLLTAAVMLCGRRRSREEILALQNRRLRRLVMHAYHNVPYYRRLMDKHGLDPRDIRTVSDLQAFPISTKNDLRKACIEDTLARGVNPQRLFRVRTSGYSGEPFTIRRTWTEQFVMLLFPFRTMRYEGLRARDRRAAVVYLRPGRGIGEPLYRRALNTFGLYPHRCVDCYQQPGEILQALREYRPDVLAGYGGTLALIACHATERDRCEIRPRLILSGAEVLTEASRRQIGSVFGAAVRDLYGAQEVGLIAWECRQTGELHVCDDSVIVEVLKDGRQAGPGEEGEVVVTGIHFFAAPFIRYRLADIVTVGSDTCRCGEPFSTFRQVQGRTLDHLLLPDGRLVHPYQVINTFYETAEWLWSYQLAQEGLTQVTLRVVPSRQPTPEETARVEEAVRRILGPQVDFRIVLVPEIRPGPGGKFRPAYSLVGPSTGKPT